MLVVDDAARYREYLTGRRLNVIDRGHQGNIHQRVGEYVLMRLRRSSVDDWWVEQKFTDDRREPRAGLYRDVQWEFATAYDPQAGLARERILDFGCGPGLFSRLFARHGATVLGLDINLDHLETARRLARDDGLDERCEFRELVLPIEDGLAPLAEERFDRIFLSDVLMFYFHPYDPGLELDPVALMQTLAGLLAPDGRIEVLEPNGVFWQQPWLGNPERPFTILTEYRHRHSGVTPTLEQNQPDRRGCGPGHHPHPGARRVNGGGEGARTRIALSRSPRVPALVVLRASAAGMIVGVARSSSTSPISIRPPHRMSPMGGERRPGPLAPQPRGEGVTSGHLPQRP